MVTVDAGSLKQEVKGDGRRMDVDLARIDGRDITATRSAERAKDESQQPLAFVTEKCGREG